KMHLIPLNSASLQETIATESQGHLVVIMFSASWCQPCNRAKPLVNVMASCLSDVSFGVLVSDESPANEACAMSFDVNAFPTIILFLDGQEVWRQRGFNQLELINRIQQLRPQLDECVAALLENEPGLARSAANILLRIADNILAHPIEEKYRRLKVSSNTVSEKLLPVSGGIECLFAMGFTDDAGGSNNGEYFELAPGPLVRVAKIRNQLVRVVTDSRHLPSIYVNMIPALASPKATNHQLVFSLMSHLSGMPKYEDPGLQSRARECIPLTRLEEAARTQVRQQLSAGNSGGCQLTEAQVPAAERDALLCELTAWFKTEFFKWTNSPKCSVCHQDCQSSSNAASLPPNEEERRYGAIRVESHYCQRCQRVERFPRYNHPEKLLQTRHGRCGEWANCFYLLCRALNFDTRFTYDVTDHVWVEVFSELEQRWLHVDPCENLIDAPLVYESGWKKSLSFVFAMSHEELVDVSWRYSAEHKQLLTKRRVNEIWLDQVVDCLERTLQNDYLHLGTERKRLLRLRRVHEIVEFLTPRRLGANSAELQGRQSGSLVWRLNRGETSTTAGSNDTSRHDFKFTPNSYEAAVGKMCLTYDPVKDVYQRAAGNNVDTISGWHACLNRCSRLARKLESDWQMVYLCRPEGCPSGTDGEASWLIDLAGSGFVVGKICVNAEAKIFDGSASVRWSVELDGSQVAESKAECFRFETQGGGAKSVRVTALLAGGQGDLAWQKCQLFRRSLDGSGGSPFSFIVELQPDSLTDESASSAVPAAKARDARSSNTPAPASSSSASGSASDNAASSLSTIDQSGKAANVDGAGDSGRGGYVITPTERELASGQLALTYDIFSDKYTRSSDDHSATIGWRSCTFSTSNLRRVLEDNPGCPGRKVAFLCRERGGSDEIGSIEWRVDLSALGGAYRLANLRLMLSLAANHCGVVVETCLSSDTGTSVTVQESFYSGEVANGARWLSVRAQIRQLPNETGSDSTWGQLFRVADSSCPLLPLSLSLDIVKV
ncbi:hypothetical protein BOX15_Mlig018337g1, partial [Macrostomum lignano]